jgi:adenine-specific DNA-methyltransferase
MGNKDELADRIVRLTAGIPTEAPLIDLFGGMCSVAGASARTARAAWANDVQHFAVLTARCLLTAKRIPPRRSLAEAALAAHYRRNLQALRLRFEKELTVERRALFSQDHHRYTTAAQQWRHVGNDASLAAEVQALRDAPKTFPYRLTTLTFAWGYFGLEQAIQLDSLRYAIDTAEQERSLTAEGAQWCRLALLGAASRIASSPGHFAQYLRGDSPRSFDRVRNQRRRAAWDWCLAGLDTLRPFGDSDWRRKNKVFRSDALRLWSRLDRLKVGRAVVYADPPYSKEHYSRYYHVLESLARYDYPSSEGMGRYRADRFRTPFSVKTEVIGAMHSMCEAIVDRGWTLVFSYPSSGLLTKALSVDPGDLLSEHFDHVRLALSVESSHSTLGARHGDGTKTVDEYVWLAS